MSRRSGEVLAISFNIWINGFPLTKDRRQCITDISIKETVDGANTATIKISDPKFLFIEDNVFCKENKIKITLGWSGVSYRETFEGYISLIDIDFPNNGVPVLTIYCMDNTHLMNREKKSRTFSNMTHPQVVQQIVQEYGYVCVPEPDPSYKFEPEETITQSNETDIAFIQKLAGSEVYPFSARLLGNLFFYVKKGHLAPTPSLTLSYNRYPNEIISFSPKINQETIKQKVSTSKVDSEKQLTTGEITNANTTDSKVGSNTGNTGGGGNDTQSAGSSSKATKTYDPKIGKWSDS